jgi:hypothetical protein
MHNVSFSCGAVVEHTAMNVVRLRVISGFRRHLDDICALMGYYAALSGSCVPTFRGNLSVPSSRFKKSKNVH